MGRKEQLYKISEWKPVQLRPLGVSLHRLGLNCNYGLVLWAGEGGPKTKHHRDVHPSRPAYGAEQRQIRQGCRATRSRRIHYVSFFPGFFFFLQRFLKSFECQMFELKCVLFDCLKIAASSYLCIWSPEIAS